MNLAALDLNLLVALDALLLEANVSRAAMRIGLSQPAASHALQRLRDMLGDPLLVRVGARMELTPRAQALRGPLAQALDQVRGLFISDDFDAARSERHFRLMMPDLAVELLVPPLMQKVSRLAPNVRLDIVPWRGPAIFNAEFARTIDLVISIGDAFKGFHRQLLYTDHDALAVRRGHPAGAKLKRRDVFLDARHVAVVIRGQNTDLIDDWLRTKGIERRIALGVGILLWLLSPVLTPFLLGAILAYILQPGVAWMVRRRVPRGLAALLMMLLFTLLMTLLVLLVLAVIQKEGPQLRQQVPVLFTHVNAWLQP
ncbi:MAG TPA: AI-2E family transporter, partial [Bradyrhizobium sp.]|nr:AI-2E family transporter [Bradyrhizobium sp.]